MKAYLLAELGQYYMKKCSYEKALQVLQHWHVMPTCQRELILWRVVL
jgi:hypothetical protein